MLRTIVYRSRNRGHAMRERGPLRPPTASDIDTLALFTISQTRPAVPTIPLRTKSWTLNQKVQGRRYAAVFVRDTRPAELLRLRGCADHPSPPSKRDNGMTILRDNDMSICRDVLSRPPQSARCARLRQTLTPPGGLSAGRRSLRSGPTVGPKRIRLTATLTCQHAIISSPP